MNFKIATAALLILVALLCAGCTTQSSPAPTVNKEQIKEQIQATSNGSQPIANQATPAATLNAVSGMKTFSKAGINFQYPDSYQVINSDAYKDEALELQSTFHPEQILVRLKSADDKYGIGVYRYNVTAYYKMRTSDGVSDSITNEIAMAKNNEQKTGNWTSPYRSAQKILHPNLNAYVVEATIEDPAVKMEKVGSDRWISAGSEKVYYIPWGDYGYYLTFSYPKTVQANADTDNRMAIVNSITIDKA